MKAKSLLRLAGVAAIIAGTTVALGTSATATPAPRSGTDPDTALSAMRRDLGLTEQQANVRLAKEARAATAETQLRQQLGDTFGGAWFDADAGTLVVGVTDAAVRSTATAAGALSTVVSNSERQLNAAHDALTARAAPAGVTGSYVDVMTNAVVVEVLGSAHAGAVRQYLAAARHTGVTVRTTQVAEAARPLYNVRGGDAWYGPGLRCSVGFSTRSGTTKSFVTAGHCTAGGGNASGYNQVFMGPMSGSTFNINGDYGKVTVTSASWTLTATVKTSGADLIVRGSTEAAVGASVCRSGSTTGWRCGTITAKNQTVSYAGGPTVGGLTRTTACAEPGDSGGSFITTAGQAQGMTSGGSGNCSTGGTTFFQPVREALNAYGLTLVTG